MGQLVMDLSVNLAPNHPVGLILKNPVMAAAGPYGYGKQFRKLMDLDCLGAFVTPGTTLRPQAGASPPRLVATPAGVLHRLGWPNPGLQAVIRDYAPLWATWALPVIVNLAGNRTREFAAMAAALEGVPDIAGLELDLSCPSEEAGGAPFGYDAALVGQVIRCLRETCTLPVLAKLPLRLPGLADVALAAVHAGADAVTLIASPPAMRVDLSGRPAALLGRLSGPALQPLALRCVWEVAKAAPGVPLVGVGGISTGMDAVAFLLAGARAVQVGAAALRDPRAPLAVVGGLRDYLEGHGIGLLSDLAGLVVDVGADRDGIAPAWVSGRPQ
jgi:dihydroorotate dehydrogenase (NAD+) catalytic subunit